MTENEKIIKKLFSIVEKQQKIISKLAQAVQQPTVASDDVSLDVQNHLQSIPEAKGYKVQSATSTTGKVDGRIIVPLGTKNFNNVVNKLKTIIMGKQLKTNDGQAVNVSTNPMDISFIGLNG